VLLGSLLLFIYRRVVQDGERLHLREDVPQTPEEEAAQVGGELVGVV
jgi:hypothetical protein